MSLCVYLFGEGLSGSCVRDAKHVPVFAHEHLCDFFELRNFVELRDFAAPF